MNLPCVKFGSAPQQAKPRGFTLVELLVVMAIISILATLLSGVAAVATETAYRVRSEQMVSRIHTLLVDYYEGFQNRRVELSNLRRANGDSMGAGAAIDDALSPLKTTGAALQNNRRNRGRILAAGRLYALRELMVMEMPERWSDLMFTEVGSLNDLRQDNVRPPMFASERTGLNWLMVRKLLALRGQTNSITGEFNTIEEILANQSSECLYMVITLATGDGEARGLFSESDIGDTDGDGAPEFLDGWGQPIQFIRWAPGQNTPSQLNQLGLAAIWRDTRTTAERRQAADPIGLATQNYINAIDENYDPFDPFHVQPSPLQDANGNSVSPNIGTNGPQIDTSQWPLPVLLLPYVYSLGSDGESGIVDVDYAATRATYVPPNLLRTADAATLFTSGYNPRARSVRPDPYRFIAADDFRNGEEYNVPQMGGTLDAELAADNISNHVTATN